MGSACRCTTFQVPSSGRKIIVARTAYAVVSSLSPIMVATCATRITPIDSSKET
jgi:hypothetical protein